jgi:hypothetical protein
MSNDNRTTAGKNYASFVREDILISLKGIRKMISVKRSTLCHIENHILGKPRLKTCPGGVPVGYVNNVNAGLRLHRQLVKLQTIKRDLIFILKVIKSEEKRENAIEVRKPVVAMDLAGNIINEFTSVKSASMHFGISSSGVSRAIQRNGIIGKLHQVKFKNTTINGN